MAALPPITPQLASEVGGCFQTQRSMRLNQPPCTSTKSYPAKPKLRPSFLSSRSFPLVLIEGTNGESVKQVQHRIARPNHNALCITDLDIWARPWRTYQPYQECGHTGHGLTVWLRFLCSLCIRPEQGCPRGNWCSCRTV